MKNQKFKNYLKDRLLEYARDNYQVDKIGIKIIIDLSKQNSDSRLSYVAQTYYEAINNQRYVDRLSLITGKKSLINQDNKYVIEYDRYLVDRDGAKKYYINRIKKISPSNISYYRMAKLISSNTSNVKYCFEGDANKLSIKKLRELFKIIKNEYA